MHVAKEFLTISKAIDFYNIGDFKSATKLKNTYNQLFSSRSVENTSTNLPATKKVSLSIVVVAFRDFDIVKRCLDSFLEDLYFSEFSEIIVVDTGETRGIREFLKNFNIRNLYLRVGVNIFPSEARNIGASFASGSWLYFIDDDAIFCGKSDTFINIFNENDLNACRGKVLSNIKNHEVPKHYDLGKDRYSAELITEGNTLIRKALFNSVSGFDPLMYGHEGLELTQRCKDLVLSSSIVYEPNLVILHEPSDSVKITEKRKRNMTAVAYMSDNDVKQEKKLNGLVCLVNPDINELDGFLQRNMFFNGVKNDFIIFSDRPEDAFDCIDKYLGLSKFFVFKTLPGSSDFFDFLQNKYSYVATIFVLKNFFDFNFVKALQKSINKNGESCEIYESSRVVGYVSILNNLKVKGKFDLLDFLRISNDSFGKVKDKSIENKAEHARRSILVTSFYTEDEYYSNKAIELKKRLDDLGIHHDIRPFKIPPGMKWPDVCRKKVSFYYDIFVEKRNEFKKLIWIDVDCNINYFPSFIEDFDVDFMAFRRGFPHSLHKDRNLTRHWEPCFFVFGNTENCFQLLEDARNLEKSRPDISATDDYFFEESWRKNGKNLKVYEIPGEMSTRGNKKIFKTVESRTNGVFFKFGESGFVSEFKGTVIQHTVDPDAIKTKKEIDLKKISEYDLSYLMKLSKNSKLSLKRPEKTLELGCNENDRELVKSLNEYNVNNKGIPLFWWIRPAPGNMGDWLSPYIVSKLTGSPVRYSNDKSSRLVAVGSIAKFAREGDFVWGSGVSTQDTELNPLANYLAARGPYTALAIKKSGGKMPDVFGDPGILMPSLYKPRKSVVSGKFGLVRHFVHHGCDIDLGHDIADINILLSSSVDIENFIDQLVSCEAIITTSLHVMILCASYGIPCRLIDIEGAERSVHGDGIKYKDFFEGVGLKYSPHVSMKSKITSKDILAIVEKHTIDPWYFINLKKALSERLDDLLLLS